MLVNVLHLQKQQTLQNILVTKVDQTLIWFMYGMSTNIIFLLYLSLPFFNIYWTNHQIRILLKIVLLEIIKNLKYNSEAFNNLYYMLNNYIKSHE